MSNTASNPDRRMAGRIGGLTTASRHDPRETTAKARATFLASFERKVDPDGSLPPDERVRRATLARKAHFARLALKSAQVRRSRARPADSSGQHDRTPAS